MPFLMYVDHSLYLSLVTHVQAFHLCKIFLFIDECCVLTADSLCNVEHLVIVVTEVSKMYENAALAKKSGFHLIIQSTQKPPKEKKIDLDTPKAFIDPSSSEVCDILFYSNKSRQCTISGTKLVSSPGGYLSHFPFKLISLKKKEMLGTL